MDKARKLILPQWRNLLRATRGYCKEKQDMGLFNFPLVQIGEGKFKYILVQVYIHGESINAKEVVRGSNAKFHLDIYDKIKQDAEKLNLCTQCLGGGYIVHESTEKYIKIYGRSKCLGKANHLVTKDILFTKYPDYKIEAEKGGMGL